MAPWVWIMMPLPAVWMPWQRCCSCVTSWLGKLQHSNRNSRYMCVSLMLCFLCFVEKNGDYFWIFHQFWSIWQIVSGVYCMAAEWEPSTWSRRPAGTFMLQSYKRSWFLLNKPLFSQNHFRLIFYFSKQKKASNLSLQWSSSRHTFGWCKVDSDAKQSINYVHAYYVCAFIKYMGNVTFLFMYVFK